MAKLWETWKNRAETAEHALFKANDEHAAKVLTLEKRVAELEQEREYERASYGQQVGQLHHQLDVTLKAKTQLEAKQHAIVTLLSSPT